MRPGGQENGPPPSTQGTATHHLPDRRVSIALPNSSHCVPCFQMVRGAPRPRRAPQGDGSYRRQGGARVFDFENPAALSGSQRTDERRISRPPGTCVGDDRMPPSPAACVFCCCLPRLGGGAATLARGQTWGTARRRTGPRGDVRSRRGTLHFRVTGTRRRGYGKLADNPGDGPSATGTGRPGRAAVGACRPGTKNREPLPPVRHGGRERTNDEGTFHHDRRLRRVNTGGSFGRRGRRRSNRARRSTGRVRPNPLAGQLVVRSNGGPHARGLTGLRRTPRNRRRRTTPAHLGTDITGPCWPGGLTRKQRGPIPFRNFRGGGQRRTASTGFFFFFFFWRGPARSFRDG